MSSHTHVEHKQQEAIAVLTEIFNYDELLLHYAGLELLRGADYLTAKGTNAAHLLRLLLKAFGGAVIKRERERALQALGTGVAH